ncbi:hypothetical protein MKX03_017431 [Papaver bracteatum]|nr:hypothetical protein MKX03_017431 [Papaver bracteatum]
MEKSEEEISSKEEEIKNLQEKVSELKTKILVATKPLTDNYIKGLEVFAMKMRHFWKETLDEIRTTLKAKQHELVLLENVSPKAKLDYCVELLAVRVSETVISDVVCSGYKEFASDEINELSVKLVQKQLDYDSLKAEVMKLESLCQFLSTKAKDLAREHVEKLSKADEEREHKLKKLESDSESLRKEKSTVVYVLNILITQVELAFAREVDSLNNEKVILVSDVKKPNKEKAMLARDIEFHNKEKGMLGTDVEFLYGEKVILVSDIEMLKEERLVIASAAELLKRENANLTSDIQLPKKDKGVLESNVACLKKEMEILATASESLKKENSILSNHIELHKKEKGILSSDVDKIVLEGAAELIKKEKAIFASDVEILNKDKSILVSKAEVLKKENSILSTDSNDAELLTREKKKLQGDIEFLNEEKNEFVRSVISDVGLSMQEETDERRKALADSVNALEELRVLYQTQATRDRWYRIQLQEIQQELIKVLGSETGSRMTGFGVKITREGKQEIWNYGENKTATIKEVISHLTKKMLNPNSERSKLIKFSACTLF